MAPDEMIVDHNVQRTLEVPRAEKMAREFDPAALGVITLSQRDDNTVHVVDGQHRAEAAKRAGRGHIPMECSLHTGLTLAEEAHLFRLLNDTRRPSAIRRFQIREIEGEPVATHIAAIIDKFGWKVGNPGNKGCISAVSTLEMVSGYDPDADRGVLIATIGAVTEAWGMDPDGVASPVLGGVGVLVNRYVGDVDPRVLGKVMKRKWASPVSLAAQGGGLKATRGGRLSYCVAEILHTEYNKRPRSHPLPPWSSIPTTAGK